jgi:hypothetical protein
MASETPRGQHNVLKEMPVLGLLLGLLVGSVVLWVTLNDVFEHDPVLPISFLRQIAYAIVMLVGGGIGGMIQLGKQGRARPRPRALTFSFSTPLSRPI